MGRFVEMRDMIVSAIDGDGILDEIVGSDAEELHFTREMICGKRGAGHFDHDAHLDVRIEGCPFLLQFAAAFIENGVGAAQFSDAGDHRIHDAHVANRRRPQDGPQLRLEDIRDAAGSSGSPCNRETDFAHAPVRGFPTACLLRCRECG